MSSWRIMPNATRGEGQPIYEVTKGHPQPKGEAVLYLFRVIRRQVVGSNVRYKGITIPCMKLANCRRCLRDKGRWRRDQIYPMASV